jgi:hypothetical protein
MPSHTLSHTHNLYTSVYISFSNSATTTYHTHSDMCITPSGQQKAARYISHLISLVPSGVFPCSSTGVLMSWDTCSTELGSMALGEVHSIGGVWYGTRIYRRAPPCRLAGSVLYGISFCTFTWRCRGETES